MWQLRAAVPAPQGPELENDDLAGQVAERPLNAVPIGQGEVGGSEFKAFAEGSSFELRLHHRLPHREPLIDDLARESNGRSGFVRSPAPVSTVGERFHQHVEPALELVACA